MKKLVSFCVFLLGLSGAANAQNGQKDIIKLYSLDCGVIQVADMDVFSSSGDYAKQTATFASTCFLIRHPSGDLLWDAGLPATLVNAAPMVNGVFTLSLDKTLSEQLLDIGLKPNDIEYLSISHSHFDHVGQVSSFPTANWLVNKKEHSAMFRTNELKQQNAAFKDLKRTEFSGDFDVFGDASVIILDLAGHTEGHTALQLKLADTGNVLISGDLFHQAKSRQLKRVPRFNHDEIQTRKSFERFENLVKKLNAKVIIQHEKTDIDQLPKLPSFLQ